MAFDSRVLFQLKPINLVPPQVSGMMTQDYHKLTKLLGVKPVAFGDSSKGDAGSFEVIA